MKNHEQELLLLATALSQLSNKERIIQLFIESLNDIFDGCSFSWFSEKTDGPNTLIEVCTRKENYGFVLLTGHCQMDTPFYDLIRNATQLLGIFLEKIEQDNLLKDQKNHLQVLVDERTSELHRANLLLEKELAERKQTEERLKKSEERNRSLIRKVQTAIVLHDGKGELLDSNPLAHELLGLTEDQMRGKSLIDPTWDFLRENGSIMPVTEYPVSIVLSSKQPLRGYVVGICRPDKEDISWVLVNAEPEYDSSGKISLVVVSFVDITERKQAGEEIAQNLAINQALSSLYFPIVTTGTSIEEIADIVLEKSRELTGSRHGYAAEIDPINGDMIAHTHTKMIETECTIAEKELRKTRFPRGEDGLYSALWGHALNIREAFYENTPVTHPASTGIPKGHIAIERFLTVPVLLSGGLVGQIALSNSTRDYTDRDLDAVNRVAEFFALAIQHKRAEEEIHTLNQELEQRVHERTAQLEAANRELEAFGYSVSHDLRAPLRHINGYIELLKKKAMNDLDEKSLHYFSVISNAAIKMGDLIDDLLSFSRMGRQEMKLKEVNLETIVSDVTRELKQETAGRNIQWRIESLPSVMGDESLLRIVMMNLFSNAVKFTRGKEQAVIEAGSQSREGKTVVFVRDNGVGFDQNYAKNLFGVFQRLHGIDEFEGTGVGLAMVQRIIHRHGGRVWAEGEVDKGAVFYFSLSRE
jgi:PAS domain S-box-containing protein